MKDSVRINLEKKDLDAFYQIPWEEVWLSRVDDLYYPQQPGYEERMLLSIGLIDKGPREPFTLLDIGSGVGIYSINIARRFPFAKIVGLDISLRQVEISNEMSRRFGLDERVKFIQGDAEGFSLPESFDYILCSELLEHVLDPDQVFDSIRRHCHEGTKMIIEVPQFYRNDEKGVFYRQVSPDGTIIEDQDVRNLSSNAPFHPFYHASFTQEELRVLLIKNHFTAELLRGCGLFLRKPFSLRKLPYMGLRKVLFIGRRVGLHLTNQKVETIVNRFSDFRYARSLAVRCRCAF